MWQRWWEKRKNEKEVMPLPSPPEYKKSLKQSRQSIEVVEQRNETDNDIQPPRSNLSEEHEQGTEAEKQEISAA